MTTTLADSPIEILAPVAELDFFHTAQVPLARPITPLEAWRLVMARPLPGMGLAFRLRDAISARFGVKRIGGFSGRAAGPVTRGGKLDFFRVERIDDEILTLTERDRHLDVMTCISTHGGALAITSSVRTHNAFGRAYMIPVGVAHRLIVHLMLRRLRADLAAGA